MKIEIEPAEHWYISISKELYRAIIKKCANGPLDYRKLGLGTYAELYKLLDLLAPLPVSNEALQEYNNLMLTLGALDDSENVYITIGQSLY